MARQPHDQFAKQYLEELLSPSGKVEVSRNVTDEVRQVDILFSPTPCGNLVKKVKNVVLIFCKNNPLG
ncbi:hypothetical protein [Nostoc sp. GT001]|uniref:hypothetical protein n=1 Tax=Nostoc sp. GT001 TaxID=3056647 RepID=UPI0025AAD44F|nr:hypothetical protein [Nostoc sp. GT001]MDM9583045.1 hypothetical protein [Nostoc sp. GT001]